ncbi:MAG: glycosyltransferase [bacterium]
MKKILVIHAEQEKFTGRVIRWKNYELHFSVFGYEDFIQHRGTAEADFVIYKAPIAAVVDQTEEGCDAVWGESPELLLLQCERARRGLRRVPFIINEQDRLRRVRLIAEWLEKNQGGNPLPDFLKREENFWFHMTKSQRQFYIDAGIPEDKLYHLSCSSYLLNFVSPDVLEYFREVASGEERTAAEQAMAGKIVAAGSNNRDYDTLCAAAENLGEEVHIICDLARFERTGPKNVVWQNFMPIQQYIRILAGAKFVVVPLISSEISGGENTTTFAMALGRAVITTRVEATEDFLTDGDNAILAPPYDAAALHEAMKKLLKAPQLAHNIGKRGYETEQHLSSVCEKNVTEVFARATESTKTVTH